MDTKTTPVLLHTSQANGVHTLTLNSPGTFNALSEEMLAALQAALDDIAADGGARAVVIQAVGKAFCAGHNLKEMRAQP
ncbi:MAG: enoyl-CoA hydratase/isomerase family protein, partial [Polaromonas sp.]